MIWRLVVTWQNLSARCCQNTGPWLSGVTSLRNHRTGSATEPKTLSLVQCAGFTTLSEVMNTLHGPESIVSYLVQDQFSAAWSRLHGLPLGSGSTSGVQCLVRGLLAEASVLYRVTLVFCLRWLEDFSHFLWLVQRVNLFRRPQSRVTSDSCSSAGGGGEQPPDLSHYVSLHSSPRHSR